MTKKIGRYSKSLTTFRADFLEIEQLTKLMLEMQEKALDGDIWCSVQLEDDIHGGIRYNIIQEARKEKHGNIWLWKKPSNWLLKVIIPELKNRLGNIQLTVENIETILNYKPA